LVPFLSPKASQLSDFGRPRASPCNDTPYESEVTTAPLKLKSPYSSLAPGPDLEGSRTVASSTPVSTEAPGQPALFERADVIGGQAS
jgi:hypothetical protein